MTQQDARQMVVALGPGRQVAVRSPFDSTSEGQTRAWGRELGEDLPDGVVVGLVGDLGAGKTVLASAILHGAGLDPSVRVVSPTFTLMNRYPSPRTLVHMDLYRLDSAADAHEAGIADVMLSVPDGVVVVEWFERFPRLWPPEYLRIDIQHTGPTSRTLRVSGSTEPQ